MLHELSTVLRYPRVMAIHGLPETKIYEFVEFLRESAEIIPLNPVFTAPIRDVNDLIVLQTAVIGEADVICTRDQDFFQPPASEFLHKLGIAVMDDIDQAIALLMNSPGALAEFLIPYDPNPCQN